MEPTGLNFTWLFLDGNSKFHLQLTVFLSVTLVPHFVITGTAADCDNLAFREVGVEKGGGGLTWWQWQFPVLLLSDCGFMNALSQDHNDYCRLLVLGYEFRRQDSETKESKNRRVQFFSDLLVRLKDVEKNRIVAFNFKHLWPQSVCQWTPEKWRQVCPLTHYTSQTKCVIQHGLDKISSLWCPKELVLHCIPSQVNGNKSSQVAGSEYWYRLPATLFLIQTRGSNNKVTFRRIFYTLNTGMHFPFSFFFLGWGGRGFLLSCWFEKWFWKQP